MEDIQVNIDIKKIPKTQQAEFIAEGAFFYRNNDTNLYRRINSNNYITKLKEIFAQDNYDSVYVYDVTLNLLLAIPKKETVIIAQDIRLTNY